jgi:FkbM family methyltransferase
VNTLIGRIGRRFGVFIIPSWRTGQIDLERHLQRLFDLQDIDCVFDIGANAGQYGQMLRKYIGYRGQIISFEPNPEVFEKLQETAWRDMKWHVEPIALGAAEEIRNFKAYDISLLGSFNDFSESNHAPRNIAHKIIPTKIQTLDKYLETAREKFGFRRPFLKLDTQGFDLEVLKGAAKSLTEFLAVQSEVAFQNIYSNSPTFATMAEYLKRHDFTLSRLVPMQDANFPELVEMDAVFIRNDFVKDNWNHNPA